MYLSLYFKTSKAAYLLKTKGWALLSAKVDGRKKIYLIHKMSFLSFLRHKHIFSIPLTVNWQLKNKIRQTRLCFIYKLVV